MVIIIYNHNGKCHLEMDDGGCPHDLGNLHTTVGDNNNDDNNNHIQRSSHQVTKRVGTYQGRDLEHLHMPCMNGQLTL